MEFLVFLLIMGVVFRNVVKQGGGKKPPVRGAQPPYAPSPAQYEQPAGQAIPAESKAIPVPAPIPAPAARPASRRPFNAPVPAPAAAPATMGSMPAPKPLIPEMQQAAQPCDDGHGSITHTTHEGKPQPGKSAKPVLHSIDFAAAEPDDDRPAATDEAAPQLLGMELDAQAMQRAVVLSEILNKRGGRHGWVRT